jgi:cytosine/creatinine deaminase
MMQAALDAAYETARIGLTEGGVPVGASLVRGGQVVATGRNLRVQSGDPTAHGEISCLRAAGRQRTYADTVLYTTLAPCAMCAGAIVQFGIPTVVVGEATTFSGELDALRARGTRVELVDDPRCVDLMRTFQRDHPDVWAEDIGEDA